MNLSARGGGEKYNFFVSGEKSDEHGVFLNNFADDRRPGELRVHPDREAELQHERGAMCALTCSAAVQQLVELDPAERDPGASGRAPPVRGRVSGLRSNPGQPVRCADLERAVHRSVRPPTTIRSPGSEPPHRSVSTTRSGRSTRFLPASIRRVSALGYDAATGYIDIDIPSHPHLDPGLLGDHRQRHQRERQLRVSSAGMQLNARKFENHERDGWGLVANSPEPVSSAAVTLVPTQGFERADVAGLLRAGAGGLEEPPLRYGRHARGRQLRVRPGLLAWWFTRRPSSPTSSGRGLVRLGFSIS